MRRAFSPLVSLMLLAMVASSAQAGQFNTILDIGDPMPDFTDLPATDGNRYSSGDFDAEVLVLNAERWTLEVYRTIIETVQSLAWMYMVVFIFTLIAYVIVKGMEVRKAGREEAS